MAGAGENLVEPLFVAQARATQRLLDQYLVTCPGCARPSALHVDGGVGSTARVVRFVCPNACPVTVDAALACLAPDSVAHSA